MRIKVKRFYRHRGFIKDNKHVWNKISTITDAVLIKARRNVSNALYGDIWLGPLLIHQWIKNVKCCKKLNKDNVWPKDLNSNPKFNL